MPRSVRKAVGTACAEVESLLALRLDLVRSSNS